MALTDPVPGTYTRTARSTPEALVRSHMQLVRKIAWHVHARVASTMEIEDMVQIGMIALVEAANSYEDRGHAFGTYASVRVRGAMIDHLRKNASICRSAMVKKRELNAAREKLETTLGRSATDAEMAEAMGLDPNDYAALLDETQSARHESLDEVYSDHSMWFADMGDAADEALDRDRLKGAIAAGIRTLPERDAMVLQLYFVEEMNLEEIGATLNVGAARICQIKKAALDKLRKSLSDFS